MAPRTDDEILASEYLRFLAVAAGLKDVDSWVDWNAQNPLHPRGSDGRYIDVPNFLQALGDMPEGEPGRGIVRRAARNRPLQIREGLSRLRTKSAVQGHLRDELSRITGREVQVDLGARMHMTTMRELAEGFLRGAEDWPDTRLERISVASRLPGPAPDAWATSRMGAGGLPEIVLNERQLGNRARFLARLRRSVETGDNRPTSDNAAYVAAHQFGHLVQVQQIQDGDRQWRIGRQVLREIATDVDIDSPPQLDAHIAGQLGTHTLHSPQEMGAEALADVFLNNEDASPMSMAIHRAIRQESGDRRYTPEPAPPPAGPAVRPAPNMVPGSVLPGSGDPWANQVPPVRPAPRRRASTSLRISEALQQWATGRGSDAPLDGFDREPLRRVARDYGIQLRRGADVTDIRRALLDHTRATVGARRDASAGQGSPAPATTSAGPRSLGDLIDMAPRYGTPEYAAMDRDIRAAFGGEFAGFRAEVKTWHPADQWSPRLQVDGDIHDARGRAVGRFSQDYHRDRSGKLIAHHGLMTLDPSAQGSGFATTYGMNLVNYYRESGVAELHTLANIDVGGYTWARGGFDFANASAARNVLNRLEGLLSRLQHPHVYPEARLRGAPDLAEQARVAQELVDRARRAGSLRHPDFPTAYEISQLGRWDGAGKDDMWIGKRALLGSSWEAVLRL